MCAIAHKYLLCVNIYTWIGDECNVYGYDTSRSQITMLETKMFNIGTLNLDLKFYKNEIIANVTAKKELVKTIYNKDFMNFNT